MAHSSDSTSHTRLLRSLLPISKLRLLSIRPRKRRRDSVLPSSVPSLLLILLTLFISTTSAVFIDFQNCLPDNVVYSKPLFLQWTPLLFDATFNYHSGVHWLNITTYGNVSGQTTKGHYPSPDSPTWSDPTSEFGKIVDINQGSDVFTTLSPSYQVLTYAAHNSRGSRFCYGDISPQCPIAPAFNGSVKDPSSLPSFSINQRFYSSFAFTTLIPVLTIKSGITDAPPLGCIAAAVTPALGTTLSNVVSYIPVLVLVLVAIATVLAATASPWGTTDLFKWTSNYGRDEDLLRLVTPGFSDCLQYIQFVFLTGGLNLLYPGFYQPIVSQISWAALLFNESFVSHGKGFKALVDGIYVTTGEYGLTRMRQLVGMSADYDMWASMAAWLLVIIVVIIAVCQLGFFLKWAFRTFTHYSAEDLRSKNWPFTGGNVVRVLCNFFLLPIAALSMFQLVIAYRSPGVVIAFAVVLLVAILAFAAWTLRVVITTKPRAHLFDDLPKLLLYGPLYNTYTDGAAPFASVPFFLTFIRGVAIGAIQPSGIAQIVILAICEVVLILTLLAFRPYHSPTSMNLYHTVLAIIRLATVMLMIAFAPSLNVSEGHKGWIGYIILFLHALVLFLGFFLNALQTIIEVIARLAGAGGDKASGAPTRGGLTKAFGGRQLSRRKRRPDYRLSEHSDGARLTEIDDTKSFQYEGRSRSLSANSAMLLNQHRASDPRVSSHLDRSVSGGTGLTDAVWEQTPRTFIASGPRGMAPGRRPQLGLKTGEVADPYYRPPRPRRATGDLMTPGDKSRGSGDWTNTNVDESSPPQRDRSDSNGRPISALAQTTPNAAYLRSQGDSETNLADPRRSNVDYAVREVDYYYGVRGPALSSQPHRKLRTGPADPVGPVSSATGWFKNILGGKTKDSGKGFEVVRSSRAPPAGFPDEPSPKLDEEPYHDSPPQPQQEAYLPGQRTRSNTGDTEPPDDDDERSLGDSDDDEAEGEPGSRVSDIPPILGPIGSVGEMDLPSRWNSKFSRRSGKSTKRQDGSGDPVSIPLVPRKQSKRRESTEQATIGEEEHSATFMDTPGRLSAQPVSARVPFSRPSTEAKSSLSMTDAGSTQAGSVTHRATASNTTGSSDPHGAEARSTSYGYVNQYRTSDGIQQSALGETGGSSAEVIDSGRSPRRSRDA